MTGTVRINMWSGPRNISTALMRSFENRADTIVVDEPLYAWYLRQTGLTHPGREEVLASQDNDWRGVVRALCAPLPDGASVLYVKQMAHHLCGDIGLDWLGEFRHAFLLRDPHAMLVSLSKVLDEVRLEDTGLPQQLRLFESLQAAGEAPPVVDSRDILDDPPGALAALCDRLGVSFDADMLRWRAGPRDSDGVWAPYWYASVNESTGFGPWRECVEALPKSVAGLYPACREIYDHLYRHRFLG